MQGRGIGRKLTLEAAKKLKAYGHDSMLVLVLAENTFKRFYESLGGKQVREKEASIAGRNLNELKVSFQF